MAPTARKPRLEPPGPGDPVVLLDVERDRGCLFLILANDGTAPAYDIRVAFDRPLLGAGGTIDVSRLAIFGNLPLLRAGREIRIFLDVAPALLARRGAKRLRATVTYRNGARHALGEVFSHDLRIWRDLPEVTFARGPADQPAPR